MSDSRDIRDQPVDPGPEELGDAGPWRNVPKPTIEELTAPSAEVIDAPQMPTAVKVVGIVLVVVLLALAAWLGLTLGGSGEPAPSPTPSIDETLWAMETPTTLGGYVRGDVTSTPAGAKSERDIVTASYADGNDRIVLLLSRPEDDLADYLENVGVEESEPVGDATCGTTVDNVRLCARVVDETAIAVGGLDEQDFEQLAGLVDTFYAALR